MFNDSQSTVADRMAIAIHDIEEWLEDNGYDVAEVVRTGKFMWDEPGYAVGAENDAVTVGYLSNGGGEPALRTYMLEEMWAMDEDEWREELEELAEEA